MFIDINSSCYAKCLFLDFFSAAFNTVMCGIPHTPTPTSLDTKATGNWITSQRKQQTLMKDKYSLVFFLLIRSGIRLASAIQVFLIMVMTPV